MRVELIRHELAKTLKAHRAYSEMTLDNPTSNAVYQATMLAYLRSQSELLLVLVDLLYPEQNSTMTHGENSNHVQHKGQL